ncbi:MAG TPA: hypothetical protein VI389_01715 [Geobacteraceae bacterium]
MRAWNHTQLLPALLVPTLVLAFLAATASAGGPGFPFGTAERDNARCLSCHGDAAKVDKARFIDPQALDHTTHAKLGCTT